MGDHPKSASGISRSLAGSGPLFGAAIFIVVAACYVLGAELAWSAFGAQLTFAFFPPAGVTVAALLLLERRWWWLVLAAAACSELFVDLQHGLAADTALMYALANTVEPLVGAATTLRWAGPAFDLVQRRSVYAFLAGACVTGPVIGGLFGVAARLSTDATASAPELIAHWWAGDGVAVLVVAAPIVVLGQHRRAVVHHAWDFLLLATVMVGGTSAAYLWGLPPVIIALPVLAWAAFRGGVLGVLVAGGLFALVTNYFTAAGYGTLATLQVSDAARIAITQAYIATIVLLAWLVSLEATERAHATRDAETAVRERERAAMRASAATLGNELTDATSQEEVLSRVTTTAQQRLEAAWVTVNLLSDVGTSYELQRGHVPELQVATRWAAQELAPGPLAARTGLPQYVEDGTELRTRFPVVQDVADRTSTQALAALPVGTETGRLGYLAVGWTAPHCCGTAEREYLSALAEVVGRALERVRLREQREQAHRRAVQAAAQHARARHRAETLATFSAALSQALRPEDVATTVLELVRPTLACDAMTLGVADEARVLVHWLAIDGMPEIPASDVPSLPLTGDSAVAEAMRSRRPIVLEDVRRHAELFPARSEAVRSFVQRTQASSFVVWPLASHQDAQPLGTLGIFWRAPHVVDETEHAFIGTVATLIAQALIRAQAFTDEEAVAASMQRAVIPTHSPRIDEFEIGAFYRPATRRGFVGGDWYDALVLPKGRVLFAVGDVVGHGIAAAQDMIQLRNAARAFAMEGHGPGRILTELTNVTEHATLGGLATIVLAVWDPITRELALAGAGHPPSLLLAARPAAGDPARHVVRRVVAPPAPPLGIGQTEMPYVERHVRLEPDDVLVMFSDGLVERRGEDLDVGIDRLADRLARWSWLVDSQVNSRLLVEDCLRNGEQVDDVCLLALRYRPGCIAATAS